MEGLAAKLLGNRISGPPALASLYLLDAYLETEAAKSHGAFKQGWGYCLVSTNLSPSIQMDQQESLSPSMEDYLETILLLEKKNRVARVKDIAHELSVQMPSVTSALKVLKSRSLVEYEKNSFINLTPKGLKLARAVLRKHEILVDFFKLALGLEGDSAEHQACQIEHAISQDTAESFSKLTHWVQESNKETLAPGSISD